MAMRGHEKRAHELTQARRQLANLVASGQVSLVDRMGTAIQAGDMVMMNLPNQPLGRVVEVKPVIDPNQPPGMAMMVVQFTVPIQARAQVPMPSVVVVARPDTEPDAEGSEPTESSQEAAPSADAEPPKIILAK